MEQRSLSLYLHNLFIGLGRKKDEKVSLLSYCLERKSETHSSFFLNVPNKGGKELFEFWVPKNRVNIYKFLN